MRIVWTFRSLYFVPYCLIGPSYKENAENPEKLQEKSKVALAIAFEYREVCHNWQRIFGDCRIGILLPDTDALGAFHKSLS